MRSGRLRSVYWSLIVSLVVGLCGCSYLERRAYDAVDVVWADIGYGLALGGDFQVTELLHSGLMFNPQSIKFGLQRCYISSWPERGFAMLAVRDQDRGLFPMGYVDNLRDGASSLASSTRSKSGTSLRREYTTPDRTGTRRGRGSTCSM
jgi:hypothetical protein